MGMGAKLCGSLQDEPRYRKSGPTGSSYHSCWRQHAPQDPDSQRGRGSAPATRELGDTLRPSSGPLPVKTSPRSCPLPASETMVPMRPAMLLLSGVQTQSGEPELRSKHFPSGPMEATQRPFTTSTTLCVLSYPKMKFTESVTVPNVKSVNGRTADL